MKRTPHVMADTRVYQSEEGYERLMLINGWNPDDDEHLARIWIRVDRNPSASFARVQAWTTQGGWSELVVIPPNEFWREMPGYLRWANDTSETHTMRLAKRLMEELIRVADQVNL